jgi:TPR repeat protein
MIRRILTPITLALTAVLSLAFTPLAAQDFNKGLDAYNSGDYAAALREWRPLADKGNAVAQTELGWMYKEGQGVLQDYAEAVRWYRLAAEQGDDRAQNYLGYMYDFGLGVPADDAEGVSWYRLAAEQGNSYAQTDLGWMYQNGLGVPQDNILAHMWYNIGATNGRELGGTNRDSIADGMTRKAIEQAQAMARECMSSDYQNCGY